MGTIRVRFILVALVVSFFAVGMSAFLNYFKYKSTIGNIVKSRVLVVGRGIENSVQASLQLGMQFSELSQLPQLMQREKSTDRLVRGIDVFDYSGQIIYSTDRARVGQKVPATWTQAAERSKTTEWTADESNEYVAGISVKNAFDLTVGFLALRYGRDEVENAAAKAGREILLAAIASFLGIAIVAPLALIVVIRRFERDLRTLEAAASHLEDRAQTPLSSGSAFDSVHEKILRALLARVRGDHARAVMHAFDARQAAEAQAYVAFHFYAMAIEARARVDMGEEHTGILLATTALGAIDTLQGSEYGLATRALGCETLRVARSPQAEEMRERAARYARSLLEHIRDPLFRRSFVERRVVPWKGRA